MAYNPKTWSADESPTAAKMNQTKDSLNFLFDRFLPILDEDCECLTSLGFYLVHFALIDPTAASGSGLYGCTWENLYFSVGFAMEVKWPDTIFTGTPVIVGHTSGSQNQWGRMPVSRWAETATGYKVGFKDSGGDQYLFNTLFSYSALVVGTRKSTPT